MAEPLRTDPPPYEVRRSDRARRIRVAVEHDGRVVVTLPRRARERDAATAVAELRGLDRPPPRRGRGAPRRAGRDAGDGALPRRRADARARGRAGRAPTGAATAARAGGRRRAGAVERFYRRAARAEIAPRADAAAAAVGRPFTKLTIRAQRTRWGSCSATGALSFNWRLLLAPEPVLDYVVWHEACHLAVLDHSPRFWALVEQHLPAYREPQRWLRRHGAGLVLPEL